MPPRRNQTQPSEPTPESRRSSLRRLSSIASLQTLNPFNRRRSNATTGSSIASSSNLSLASSSPILGKSTTSGSNVRLPFSEHDNIQVVPEPPTPKQYRSSPIRRTRYVSLPDETTGGISGVPRSKTFSNLPVPTRSRKPSLLQSKSHACLPLGTTGLPSPRTSTRLPSPIGSTRKHLIRHPTPANTARILPRRPLPRSDTEPLLVANFDDVTGGRSTAFKENISPSPTKQSLSKRAPHHSAVARSTLCSGPHSRQHGQRLVERENEPSPSESTASLLPQSKFAHFAFPPRKSSLMYNSSPTGDQASKDGSVTARQPPPMQRWNSQPVLTNTADLRTSHHEIKQARLMSARQAPTPPPPTTPLTDQALEHGKVKALSNSCHLRRVSERSDSISPRSRRRASTKDSDSRPSKPATTSRSSQAHITTAEPSAYWSGRFSALNDRFRNEALLATIAPPSTAASSPSTSSLTVSSNGTWAPRSQADAMESLSAQTVRMRKAVEALAALCATDEAKASFRRWQIQLAAALQSPELARPVYGHGRGCALEMSLSDVEQRQLEEEEEEGRGGGSRSVGRKVSFMDRLLGRGRKSLGTAVASG